VAMGARYAGIIAAGIIMMGTGVLIAGCAQPPAAPGPRLFSVDLAGAAKGCAVSKVLPAAGQQVPVTMTVHNDGGWCAITVATNGRPYDAGLLTIEPQHGKVLIHTVGDDTRIDYTPAAGYAGVDAFSVQLVPGSATLRTSVTVSR
jgi:hypothetical protein